MFKKKKKIESPAPTAAASVQNDIGLTTTDILKKVKDLEIKSKILTSQMFTGEYHSAFKGRGMSFREVREYNPGDDVRFIDWNVSARYAHPFSKVFEEERELVMMLLIDTSTSNLFGTVGKRKKDLITEMAAILAFSAINNNDKVGVIFFSNKIEKYIPPKKGRDHALYIVRELLTVEPKANGTNLDLAIKYFNNTTRQKSIAFILSDFITAGYDSDLKVIGKRHDVIGLRVYDKMDMQLPDIGLVQMQDAETGKNKWVDTGSARVRYNYQQHFFEQTELAKRNFRKAGAELLHIRTDEDYVKILQQFFLRRN